MSNEAIAKMIDNIANKEFAKAGDDFEGLIGSKLNDTLDQARTKIASQIFDPQVGVEPDEELVAGEVSNDDLEAAETDNNSDAEAEAAADEVEAEVDEVEEFDLDDEELDDDDTGTEEDTSGDDEEPEETSDEDSK